MSYRFITLGEIGSSIYGGLTGHPGTRRRGLRVPTGPRSEEYFVRPITYLSEGSRTPNPTPSDTGRTTRDWSEVLGLVRGKVDPRRTSQSLYGGTPFSPVKGNLVNPRTGDMGRGIPTFPSRSLSSGVGSVDTRLSPKTETPSGPEVTPKSFVEPERPGERE